MNGRTGLEKSAMSEEQKRLLIKYLKYGTAAGVLSSGLGLALSRAKANKERSERKAEEAKGAIVVDISKDSFLKDVMKPEEQSALFAGQNAQKPQLQLAGSNMTPEQIAALKKDIIRRNERKMNFFGTKAAEDAKKKDKQEKPTEAEPGKSSDTEKKAPELPRDSDGRFVSPTSPVAVMASEKFAEDGGYQWFDSLKRLFTNPADTAKGVWDAAKGRPVALAAGGLGALYLSALIVDKVNSMRAKASKRNANEARKEYVKLLQNPDGEEKTAQADPDYSDTKNPFSAAGTVLGTAFVVPAVLSAIIANKIMQRRKEKEKKNKLVTNSFPEDPVVLYKTSEDKEIRLSPEAALTAIMLKQAMFEVSGEMEKSAQDGAGDDIYKPYVNYIIGAMGDKSNSDDILGIAKAYTAEPRNLTDVNDRIHAFGQKTMMEMFKDQAKSVGKSIANVDPKSFVDNAKALGNWAKIDAGELSRRVSADPRTHSAIVSHMDRGDKGWNEWLNETAGNRVGRYLKKDSPFYNIVMWMMNNLGIGKYLAKKGLKDHLSAAAGNNQ